MKDIALLDISLMEIQIFLKAAVCGTFAGAARELNITPGMVSKRIVALENKTGLLLFIREGNRVVLTPAGRELWQEWEKVIAIAAEGIQQARLVQKVENSTVNFRVSVNNRAERLLMPLLRQYEAREPDFRYKVELSLNFDLLPVLVSGECDAGFLPALFEEAIGREENLDCLYIARSPLYAALDPENPLAGRSSLTVQELRPLEFLLSSPGEEMDYRQMILELCRRAGFQPKICQYLQNGGMSAYLNLQKNRVFITDRFYHAFGSSDVVYVPLENTQSGMLLVWRKSGNRNLKQFIQFVRHNSVKSEI